MIDLESSYLKRCSETSLINFISYYVSHRLRFEWVILIVRNGKVSLFINIYMDERRRMQNLILLVFFVNFFRESV